jgi:hypothetical protein
MGWANPVNPVKPTQSNPKKWIGPGNWVDMDLKTRKPTKNFGLWANPDPYPKTH